MGTNSGQEPNSQNKGSNGQDRNNKKVWSFSSQETFVGVVAVLIIVCWVGLPIWSVTQFIRDGSTSTSDAWTPLLSVFVALTTMTVSAIFLFMTFRIDRGAKFEARSVARKIAKEATKEATKKAKEAVTEVEKKIEETITKIKKEVEEKAIKAITEVEKEVKRKAAEAIDGIKNKVEKVDDDQNKIIERINQLTDESIHKQIDASYRTAI